MSTTLHAPMTVEEFDQAGLPENYELHGGEPVEMSVAGAVHSAVQGEIFLVFRRVFSTARVEVEMPFRIKTTRDKRAADVGVTTLDRWQTALRENILEGSPEIVVEVLSPSNNALELEAYQTLCFEHGTEVFLTIYPDARTVKLRRKGFETEEIRGIGAELVLELWGESHTFTVRDFFAGLPSKP